MSRTPVDFEDMLALARDQEREDLLKTVQEWRPVIKAAEALLRWEQGEGPRSDGGRVSDDLRNATLALQEARDE